MRSPFGCEDSLRVCVTGMTSERQEILRIASHLPECRIKEVDTSTLEVCS